MTNFEPTPEQQQALALFATGESLVIEAGAGTGKTSTLKLLSESTSKRIQYTAFSKSLVEDAKKAFPSHVAVNTAHSLAYRAIGHKYRPRMDSARRMRSMDIARHLRVDPIWVVIDGVERRCLQPSYLAGLVMRTVINFCQSDDDEIATTHVPYIRGIDVPGADGKKTYANNREVAKAMLPAAKRAWSDLQRLDGVLPFSFAHYLKIWALNDPVISAPVIMIDEAQDLAPVLLGIIKRQTHAQIVWVGDGSQSIMGFTGAINAMEQTDAKHRTFLTQSFRFGQDVANIANVVLDWLDAPLVLRGSPFHESSIGPLDNPKAILTRTNAAAVIEVLNLQRQGARVHLVGGSADVLDFAEAARELIAGRRTDHRDLACFSSWAEVIAYTEQDEQGGDLRLMVKLVEEFGVDVIINALRNMAPETSADVVVSTAHRSKGREWDTVRLGSDFPEVGDDGSGVSVDELRLLYVAVTRAKVRLDIEACPALICGDPAPEPTEPAAAPEPVAEATLSMAPEGSYECQGPTCGRAYEINGRSGLADERFCGGLCRAKAERPVAV